MMLMNTVTAGQAADQIGSTEEQLAEVRSHLAEAKAEQERGQKRVEELRKALAHEEKTLVTNAYGNLLEMESVLMMRLQALKAAAGTTGN